ncbi:MAG: septal ring lytic transglycosylase RlpA family protein [Bacteroidota bacterium]
MEKSLKIASILCCMMLMLTLLTAQTERGEASYYADSFQGKPTASGEPYDRNKLTAAHRTLPFGTRLKVTRTDNGKSVVVKVNDRGPHKAGRIVDLSYAAAAQIGLVRDGVAPVKIEVVGSSASASNNVPANNTSTRPTSNNANVGRPTSSRPSTVASSPPNTLPTPPRNVGDLPLRDHAGNLIGAGNEAAPSGNASPASTAAEVANPAPGMEDAKKYTPALYQFVAFKLDSEGYGVQVGAFFNFYRLMAAMDELSDKGIQNTMVQSSLKDGKPVFRILVGPYDKRTQANQVKKSLASKKIKGIVVDLSSLK